LQPAEATRVGSLLDRVLIVGGAGQLGRYLQTSLAGGDLIAPARDALDLEDPDAVGAALGRFRPTLVVNAAAYHHVERCEERPERAFAVNALAVDRLASACALAGAALVTFSTDYVFDGEASEPYAETAPANPLNAYGASKLAGEHLTRRHGPRHFIVRTSGLYGSANSSAKGPTFIARILAQAEAGQPLRVVDDVTFSPSYAPDVAAGLRRIVDREAYGTYHLANAGATTWHAFAATALELAGVRADLSAVPSSAFPSVARRPRYSALRSDALAAPLRDWREALADYVTSRARA
jgi:dTDP-4-dehydrorhamnose reductase